MKIMARLAMRWRWHRDEARRLKADMPVPLSLLQRAEKFFHRRGGGDK